MTPLEKVLLEFTLIALKDETCQQGGKGQYREGACGRPAAYEALYGDHLMCGSCAKAWYAIKENKRNEYTERDFRSGLARKGKHGWFKRIEARRRDEDGVNNPLSSEAVEALIMLEAQPVRRKPLAARGKLVRTCRSSVAHSKARIDKGQLMMALNDAIEGWIPVLFRGRIEFVPDTDLKLDKKKKAKP